MTASVAEIDAGFMRQALAEAAQAATRGEVPVGAVLVAVGGEVLAAAGNRTIARHDPTAHAEILTLRAAGNRVQNYRLVGATLYVTLEPCPMCATAMVHGRIARLVFGALDPKGGGVLSRYGIGRDNSLNHQFDIEAGVLATECATLLRDFFLSRRK